MLNKDDNNLKASEDCVRFSKYLFPNCEEKKVKMKRPERQRYVPPNFRSEVNKDYEDKIKCAEDKYADDVANRQAYSLRERGSSQRTTNRVSRRVRFDCSSSSSNSRNVSDESCKDDDSSDFEECCNVLTEAMSDIEISMGKNEKNSDDHWKKERRAKPTKNNHDIETENYQTNTKISNRILTKHGDYSDVKSHANQLLNSESNENKLERRQFFNYDDSSISDIEAVIDSHVRTGRVLTSTPNSDIVDEKVLDAAKYDPEEESGLESTLLGQSDIREITINTNRNKCDYNFDIYQDPSPVKDQPTDYSEILGNNYIPPPVPPPISAFRLPLIHRLPSPVSSPHKLSVLRHVSPQKMPQLPTQLRRPRLLLPSHMPSIPRYVLSPRLQPSSPHAPNPPRMPSSMPPTLLPQERFNPPHLSRMPSSIPQTHLPQGRFYTPNLPRMPSYMPSTPLPQERFYLPRSPQDASNSLYLHQRSRNPRSLESYEQNDFFYIPPPVPPPQQMNVSQQIRNLNQFENVQSSRPSSISLINKVEFDHKIWPRSLKTKGD